MNRAQVKALFPDITDEQLKAIMDMNGNDVNAAKTANDAALAAALEEKEQLQKLVDEFNAQKKQTMSREEQLEAALKDVQAKQAETAIGWNRMSAASEFSGLGLSEEHLSKVLDAIVSEDRDETAKRAAEFASIFKSSSEAAVAAHVKSAQTQVPAPQGGTTVPSVSKEEFEDMTYMERLAMFNESPDTYKELNS